MIFGPGFALQLMLTCMWQALAELYHVQPQLIPEDAAASLTAATDSSNKPNSALLSTPAGQIAAAAAQEEHASEAAHSSFISRQQLGICSTADTPIPDSAAPYDEAVGVTADETILQDTPMASAAAASETQSLSGAHHSLKPPVQQKKPLCSQEWNVQHVREKVS